MAARPRATASDWAAYTSQNLAAFDVYDSAPGLGNGTVFEFLGDAPNDPDTAGQLGPTDPPSLMGQESANFIANLAFLPGQLDGIDTVEEYLEFVPNPLKVTNTVPANSELDVALGSTITIQFDATVNPASINLMTMAVQGDQHGPYVAAFMVAGNHDRLCR